MTCAACNVAADCSGNETECEHRTCTAGVCGSMREAAGTVLTVQATGDCKRRQCAADGTVANANDDTDVPEDRNPCTNDICTTGAPSHTMMPANSNCGGANHCNATASASGARSPRTARGPTPPAAREPAPRPASADSTSPPRTPSSSTRRAGDCKGLQCDGAGNPQVFNDNLDLPVDDNVCTTDECSSTAPRPTGRSTSGTACGGSLVCDGANNCVQCLSASTCPGTDTDCHTRSCVSGQCGITNAGRRDAGRGADAARLQEERLQRPGDVRPGQRRSGPAGRRQRVHAGRLHRRNAEQSVRHRRHQLRRQHDLRRSGRLRHLPDGVELPRDGRRLPHAHVHQRRLRRQLRSRRDGR